jgi:hypothetical protein
MAIRRLVNMIQAVDQNIEAARGNGLSPLVDNKTTAPAFVEVGSIVSAGQQSCIVTFRGATVSASLAYDGPLQAGQPVFVMETDDGSAFVLGPVNR